MSEKKNELNQIKFNNKKKGRAFEKLALRNPKKDNGRRRKETRKKKKQ